MPYKLYLNLYDHSYTIDIDSIDYDTVNNVISDYVVEVTDELLWSYEPVACGYFPEPWRWGEAAYSATKEYIHANANSIQIYAVEQRDNVEIGDQIELRMDIPSIMCEILDNRSQCEQESIDSGEVMLKSLTKFLSQGVWQYGFHSLDDNGASEPILWFGLPGEAPIDCWSLSKATTFFDSENESWKWFWFCDFWTFAWDILMVDGDIYTTWMFTECGMDEPPIDPVRQSCPIELNENDTNEELLAKVEQFVLKNMQG